MPEYESRPCAHGASGTMVHAAAPDVTWPAAMLEADPAAAAAAFDRAIGGLAWRLSPGDAARFLFALDSALYARLGGAAIAAEAARGEGGGAVHPKHRLTRYHDFFVERVRAGERVADLGCGLGMLATAMAARAGARVVGVDMSAANVETARRYSAARGLGASEARRGTSPPSASRSLADTSPARGGGGGGGSAAYVVADIMDIAAGIEIGGLEGGFDAVVLSNVLEHLRDRPRVLRGVMEWLGASRLLLRVPAYERDWRVAFKRELGVEWRLDPTHEAEHTREELEGELAEAGVRVEEFECRWGEYYVVGVID